MKFNLVPYLLGIVLSLPLSTAAQRSEIWGEKTGTWLLNVGLGTTHYTGDLSEQFNMAHLRLGVALDVAVAHRFGPRLSFRGETQLYYIRGSHENTHIAYNNLSFHSLNPDIWAGLQWDFWPIDDQNHAIIPYAMAGLGLTYMTPKATYRGQSYSLAPLHTEGVAYNRMPLIIRYGFGVPLFATERLKFHLEGTYTHVFSDYLDDVSTVYVDQSSLSPLAAALADRRPEIGLKPNPAGAQRGNDGRRDGYFVISGRLIFVLSTLSERNYRRMFGR